MQRHRHDEIGIGQELGAGARHPGAECRRKIEPVAKFEPVRQGAGHIVIADRGAGPLIDRRVGDRRGRNEPRAHLDRKWRPQPLAIGPLDQAKPRPASGAQGARFCGRRMADGAGWRIDEITQSLPHPPHEAQAEITDPAADPCGAGRKLTGRDRLDGLEEGHGSLGEGLFAMTGSVAKRATGRTGSRAALGRGRLTAYKKPMASSPTRQDEARPERPDSPEFDAKALAKSLLRATPAGALATLDAQGAPFSSLVTVATDVDGSPILLLSRLAAHTGHLERDGRVSLLLARLKRGDPLAHPRLTVSGVARRLDRESEEGASARRRFLACHPKAALYADFGDFAFWRIGIADAHLNGGFARAAQLSGQELHTEIAGAEALIAAEEGALAHMNSDHGEAVSLYATVLLGAPEGAWRLTGLDPEGCDLAAGEERRRLAFARSVGTPDELRVVLVELAKEARQKLAQGEG